MSMVVEYRGTALDAGNVTWSQTSQHSYDERYNRRTLTKTVNLQGLLKADTQAELKTKIETLEDIFSVDGGDLKLYHNDGATVSAHTLENNTSLSGVIVASPVSYPNGTGVEYATERTYTVTLQAEYSFTDLDNIVQFTDQLRIVGTGGPRRVGVEFITGAPEVQVTNQQTMMYATQAGSAVGWQSYYFPGPLPVLASFEQGDRRQETPGIPKNMGRAFRNYPSTWVYEYMAPTLPLVFPNAV